LRTNSVIVQKEQEFGEGPVMEIMVNIPMVSYEDMLKRCDPSRPEYELLKNGLVMEIKKAIRRYESSPMRTARNRLRTSRAGHARKCFPL
jgi:hypothetical protein